MTGVGVLGRPAVVPQPRPADARELRATPDVRRFGVLILQLLLLGAVMHVFRVEDGPFFRITLVAFGGFAVHYWTPFPYKTAMWLAVSGVGALALVGPITLAFVLVIGGVFYALLCAPWTYRTRVALLVSSGVLLMAARVLNVPGIPPAAWPVLGAIFMFRMMVYAYDLRQMKGRPPLTDYLTYFYPLPAFYFLLFPVIDFQTLRRSWYQRDIHESAQQGVAWMVRGTVQLLLYRMVYHLKPSMTPDEVTSFWSLVTAAVTTYLLYLRVSGQFHIIVGMLHLFGYDLPETHRRYLLAYSLTDFWRRINIYWKDFMVKLVYFPVYFRFRRSGDMRAQLAATAMVFVVTWLLHSYQWFWLRGAFLFTWTDTLFWGILGLLVMVNVYLEQRRPDRKRGAPSGVSRVVQTAGTFRLITTLWSLWNSSTVDAWVDVVTWWQIG
jgi:alginate O-acetyltransferase complex protein AlgI